jgi:hypothetical protein
VVGNYRLCHFVCLYRRQRKPAKQARRNAEINIRKITKMKNAFVRFGRTCVSGLTAVVIGSGLMAGGLFASQPNRVTVTLPHAVAVGSTTLPSGNYTISNLEMSDGEYFVVRGEGTPIVTLPAMKIDPEESDKTKVIFSQDGDVWHFDKLFIQGDGTGYQFVNIK